MLTGSLISDKILVLAAGDKLRLNLVHTVNKSPCVVHS